MKLRLRPGLSIIKTAILLHLLGCCYQATAKEGMWLPSLIKQREADMKSMGLEIPVEQLFNTNGTGLNNAVVLFGRGCTGEVISNSGLLLTNHHCGYGSVQRLSSTDHDYFASGFWAMNTKEELPCPGLTVTFIRNMENVTDNILGGIPDTMNITERDTMVSRRIRNLENGYKYTTHLDAEIRAFYGGNQYWVIITETFKDIRLVGFPPNGIGFFGGDTDNWMWPRHNGDFSIFRIYAGKGNKPADYAKENLPYHPKKFFNINTGGYKEGDFTMVYGFPGTTRENISSYELNQVISMTDPIRIEARTLKLNVWSQHMDSSRAVFLKYTSKKGGIANGWKKWQGELQGLKDNNVTTKKQEYEKDFQNWASLKEDRKEQRDVLSHIEANTASIDSAIKGSEYIREAALGIEIVQQGAQLNELLLQMRAGKADGKKQKEAWEGYFKNYDAATDQHLFSVMMRLFFTKAPEWVPQSVKDMYAQNGSDYDKWAAGVFRLSLAADKEKMDLYLETVTNADSNKIKADPSWLLYKGFMDLYTARISKKLSAYYKNIDLLDKEYLKYRIEKEGLANYYPDANLSLRIAYGKVKGIDPSGPSGYAYQTNVDEIIAKDNPSSEEFKVPEKLKELYAKKNYGRWKLGKTVPVAFTADNHTSGGNSGSPVLNAKGQLIGINFDRVWDGTMSDYYFDPSKCRNISVDIRYVLFITEKMGNAGWLLKEMKLVK